MSRNIYHNKFIIFVYYDVIHYSFGYVFSEATQLCFSYFSKRKKNGTTVFFWKTILPRTDFTQTRLHGVVQWHKQRYSLFFLWVCNVILWPESVKLNLYLPLSETVILMACSIVCMAWNGSKWKWKPTNEEKTTISTIKRIWGK